MIKIQKIILLIILISLLTSCMSNNNLNTNIQIYTRDNTSGTREAFFTSINYKEAIKDDSYLPKQTLIVDGNGDMINKIKNDVNGIGYISLSSYDKNDVIGLKINEVDPTYENVLNKTYTLMRNFNYIITKNNKTDADLLAQAFNAYIHTLDAKLIIKSKGGIVDINEDLKKWDDIKSDYPVTLKDNSNITLRFGGSTSVEPIAKALSIDFSIKSGNFKSEYNYTGSSAAFKATQGSDYNSNNLLHIAFLSRDLNESEIPKENTSGILSYDAIVTVVNKQNKLSKISIEKLKEIFSGEINSFDEVLINGS